LENLFRIRCTILPPISRTTSPLHRAVSTPYRLRCI
jgi:hypothetical protein